jgi:hypothetical protein
VSFGSLRLWISEVFDFACLLAGLGQLRLLRLIFTLAFVSFFHLLWPFLLTCLVFRLAWCFDLLGVSTCLVFQLASCCDLLRLDLSTSLRALAVSSLGGLIIFRMLGAFVDSSGTHITAHWVHPSPLDFSVVKGTLVLHSGASGRVIVYEDYTSCRVIPLSRSLRCRRLIS